MAEKLSEATWTDFAKKQKLALDDKALVKALAGFDKAGDGKAEARLAALDEVVEQLKKQVAALAKVKKQLGDKPFAAAKDKLFEIMDSAEKLQKELRQPPPAEAEEEDSPVLLTTAMVPLLRVLQKGEVQMHALIAATSKRAAVLIMRRSISPTRRKLLAEYLQEKSGIKYIVADVAGRRGEVDFLLDSPVAGMAKKLRQALLDQTGVRTKVFVQFGDETETDEGDEADRLERAAQTAAAAAAEVPSARAAPGVAFTQTRLAWDKTRQKVQSELRKLEASILAICKDEPDVAQIAAGTRNLYTVLDFLDERLIDKLDEALNAADPATRKQRNDEAREIVEEYVDFVESEDLMQDIDDNGFTSVEIKSTLTASLKAIGQRLRA